MREDQLTGMGSLMYRLEGEITHRCMLDCGTGGVGINIQVWSGTNAQVCRVNEQVWRGGPVAMGPAESVNHNKVLEMTRRFPGRFI